MTNRTMGYFTNIPPPSNHHCYSCPFLKSRPRPTTHMTTRSAPRTRPNHRTNSIDLTKTSTFRPTFTNPGHQPYNPNRPWHYLYLNWRLRRAQPNTAPKNYSIFLYSSPRLNNLSPSILPHPDPSNSSNISSNNILNIPRI